MGMIDFEAEVEPALDEHGGAFVMIWKNLPVAAICMGTLGPMSPHDAEALMRQVDNGFGIVNNLAQRRAPLHHYRCGAFGAEYVADCLLCEKTMPGEGSGPANHDTCCPWRQAVEAMREGVDVLLRTLPD